MISLHAPLGGVAVGSLGVVGVRAVCVGGRRVIEVALRDDRSRAAERPLTWRAGPVALPEPRRRPRTLLLALLAGVSCALVSCVTYVQ